MENVFVAYIVGAAVLLAFIIIVCRRNGGLKALSFGRRPVKALLLLLAFTSGCTGRKTTCYDIRTLPPGRPQETIETQLELVDKYERSGIITAEEAELLRNSFNRQLGKKAIKPSRQETVIFPQCGSCRKSEGCGE